MRNGSNSNFGNKFQITNHKSQINSKFQIPNSQINLKFQIPNKSQVNLKSEILKFGIYLEFEIWDLFGIWNLGFIQVWNLFSKSELLEKWNIE